MHSKKSGRLSSTGSEILAFGSECSANFQPIFDCFIPKFKVKYDDLENIKIDRVNTVVFNLHEVRQSKFFWDTRYNLVCHNRQDNNNPNSTVRIDIRGLFSELDSTF